MTLSNLLGQTSAGGNQAANMLFHQNAGPRNSSLSRLDLDSQQDILRDFRMNSSSMDSIRSMDETRRTSTMPPSILASSNSSRALQAGVLSSRKNTRNSSSTSGNIDDIINDGSYKVPSSSSFAGDEDAKAPTKKRAASFAEAAAVSAEADRVEQKRFREQKRRSNLTDKFQALSSLLWDIDDTELDPTSLDVLTGTVSSSPDRKKRERHPRNLSDAAVPTSNRIEVMARAIEVISTLRNVNRGLKEKLSIDGNDHH